MRIRTIKPQFWTSKTVGELSAYARLLFIGTWNLADDDGILLWDVDYLKGQLFTYDKHLPVAKYMKELTDKKLVITYQSSDNQSTNNYAIVRSFVNHQSINRPTPSNLPHPPENLLQEIVSKFNENSVSNHGNINEDSPLERNKERNKERSITQTEEIYVKDDKEKYGQFKNVFLSTEELNALKEKFPNDWNERIEKLSEYIAGHGKKYKSHYAVILGWARSDAEKNNGGHNGNGNNSAGFKPAPIHRSKYTCVN